MSAIERKISRRMCAWCQKIVSARTTVHNKYWIEIFLWEFDHDSPVLWISVSIRCAQVQNITAWKVSVCGVFLVHVFLHSDWIRRDMEYVSVFGPNMGKCRSEKLQIRRLFTKCMSYRMYLIIWLANIKYAISLQKKTNIKSKICFFSYFWNQRSLCKRLSFILMISETKNRRQKALTGLRKSITKLNLTDCRSNKVDNILFKVSFLQSHDNPKTTFSSLYFF